MGIKTMREQAGLSQYRLAKLSGVSQTHISKLELGQRAAGGEVLLKLSRCLSCRIEDLLHRPEDT